MNSRNITEAEFGVVCGVSGGGGSTSAIVYTLKCHMILMRLPVSTTALTSFDSIQVAESGCRNALTCLLSYVWSLRPETFNFLLFYMKR